MPYDLIHMWNLKKNNNNKKTTTNQQNETKMNSQMERKEQISGSQWGRGLGVGKMDEGVNCIVMDNSQTCVGDHFVVYAEV